MELSRNFHRNISTFYYRAENKGHSHQKPGMFGRKIKNAPYCVVISRGAEL